MKVVSTMTVMKVVSTMAVKNVASTATEKIVSTTAVKSCFDNDSHKVVSTMTVVKVVSTRTVTNCFGNDCQKLVSTIVWVRPSMVALYVSNCPRGAAAPVLFRAWQFATEGCMYTEGGFLRQESTVHVGLPSEPNRLKHGNAMKMKMNGNKLKCIENIWEIHS